MKSPHSARRTVAVLSLAFSVVGLGCANAGKQEPAAGTTTHASATATPAPSAAQTTIAKGALPPNVGVAAANGSEAPVSPKSVGGFARVESLHNAERNYDRWSSPPGGNCMAELTWWPGRPKTPGGPMVVASKRMLEAGGQTFEVVTTSMFGGKNRKVDLVFRRQGGAQWRFLFEDCGETEEKMFLADFFAAQK